MNVFRDLIIWRESIVLVKDIYKVADLLPKTEEYNLKQQLKRAVVSVSLNIAEGKNRKTGKDFLHFLSISSGSISEVEAILTLSEELGYIKVNDELRNKLDVLSRKINSFRKSLASKCN
ncbi:MAG: four helix bundle protein [Candidatus Goldbacteria bacterium]|nr:four helix bundle protein [Candidatus Goldiibacteriota bacterium]